MWSNPGELNWRQAEVSTRVKELIKLFNGPLPESVVVESKSDGNLSFLLHGVSYRIVYGEANNVVNCLIHRNRQYVDPGAYPNLLSLFIAEIKR